MARFFLPTGQIEDHRATITGVELNHLRRVLRLRPQDRVVVFDDAGCEHEGIIRSLSEDRGEIEIIRSYQVNNESPLKTTLALGLTKGEKMDWVVEKATELGVHTIVPFRSDYTIPKLNERKMAQRSERWQKIALSAAKQCGRVRIPEILALSEFCDLLETVSPDALRLLFWEKEREQRLSDLKEARTTIGEVVVMIGPEGGFSAHEAALALGQGFKAVRLGPRILRAETAAVAALSAIQLLWGDLA
ncbi:MAG TPA: 16S rRNA (uracil(1498)-N(3))-methyltransferase [Pyrinomonadaceae bacterium]|nr:16S rRNA (uracil(1498)-N(3))-methyltransferase [Pyrinomonadaceae bacterium]